MTFASAPSLIGQVTAGRLSFPDKDKNCVVEGRGSSKEDAVEPVQNAAMSRDDDPGILYAKASLQQRFEQVAELPENAEEESCNNSIDNTELRKKGKFGEKCPGKASCKPPHAPSTLLFGLTSWVQLFLAESRSCIKGSRIARHNNDQHEEESTGHRAGSPSAAPDAQKKRHIEKPHEQQRDLSGRLPDITDPEKEEETRKNHQQNDHEEELQLIVAQ